MVETDFDKFINLLTGFGVQYEIDNKTIRGRSVTQVILTANGRRSWGDDTKVEGYESFYTIFEFNSEDGKFNVIGIWE